MGSKSSVASSATSTTNGTASERVVPEAVSGASAAVGQPYGNAAAQEALLAKEQARLTGREWVLEDYTPSTGIGKFDLAWNPATGVLLVTSRLAFEFLDSHPKGEAWLESGGGSFAAERFAWQPGEAERWKADAIAEIEAAWSTGAELRHATLPGVAARVVVHVEEVEPEEAHFTLVVKKVPEDREEVFRDHVDTDAGTVALNEASDDGVTEVDGRDRTVAAPTDAEHRDVGILAREPVRFARGSAALAGADKARVGELARALGEAGRPRFPISAWGFAGLDEGDAQEQDALAGARVDAVAEELLRGSPRTPIEREVVGGREGDTGRDAPRVQLYVGTATARHTTVVHEFGHVLGLPDEYVDEDGDVDRPAGETDLGYPDQAHAIAGDTLVARDDERVMSVGDEVKPHHHVTILEALERMTGTEGQWSVGR